MKIQHLLYLLVIVVIFSLACPGLTISRASALDKKLAELEQMQREIEEHKKQISSVKSTESSILKELERLELDLMLCEKELAYIQARTAYLNDRIAATSEEIDIVETQLTAQKEAFETRLVSMYKAGRISYLEVLLDSESLSEFMWRLRYLRDIAAQDNELIDSYNESLEELLALKAELESDKQDLENLRVEEEQKKVAIASRSYDREQYLAKIQSERKQYERALDEMERQSQELTKIIQQLQAEARKEGNVQISMIRPVVGGWISSYYGNRWHPLLGGYRFHSGIDFAVNRGTPIMAAEAGTVIFSGNNGGYGLCVILDHGGGLSTLYAHADKILVKIGDEVLKGQTIALVGSTGISTGPHLHFEVRVNGNTEDPLKWLPK